jgi:hypothetical protein
VSSDDRARGFLPVGHVAGDFFVQSSWQAQTKGKPGSYGHLACFEHVVTLTCTKAVVLSFLCGVTGTSLGVLPLVIGVGVDAVSHYVADRRGPMRWIAVRLGKGKFYDLGDPAVAPCGTGAFAIDQAWHVLWLFVAAVIVSI